MTRANITQTRRDDWTPSQRLEYQRTVVAKHRETVAELSAKLATAKANLAHARRQLSRIRKHE